MELSVFHEPIGVITAYTFNVSVMHFNCICTKMINIENKAKGIEVVPLALCFSLFTFVFATALGFFVESFNDNVSLNTNSS
jgi:hypothetical protein